MYALLIGSGGSELIYSIFGGDVEDLRIWLNEERLPDGWEPKNREAYGLTVTVRSILSLLFSPTFALSPVH